MRRLMLEITYLAFTIISLLDYCNTEKLTKDFIDKKCNVDTFDEKGARCGAPPGTYPLEWVPENMTEVDRFCSIANKYGPCFLKWDFICNDYDTKRYTLGAHLDACAPGSAVHEGLRENIECIYKTYKAYIYGGCEPNIHKGYYDFVNSVKAYLSPELSSREAYIIPYIIWTFEDLGCFLSKLKCPPAAEDGFLEIYAKTYASLHKESLPLKEKTFEIMEHLPMEDVQKTWVKDAAQKFENKCKEVNCNEYEDKLRKLYYE